MNPTIMTPPPPANPVVMFEPHVMPQTRYPSVPGHQSSRVYFGWLNLRVAKDGNLAGVPYYGEPAFDVAIGAKMSIILHFADYPKYTCQHNIGRVNRRSGPTRGDLAKFIARGVESYLMKMQTQGTPLLYNGFVVRLEDLCLWDVVHVSKGSVQPIIGIQPLVNVQGQAWL